VTVDHAAWSLLDCGGRLEILDGEECRRLLLLEVGQPPQPWPGARRALVVQVPLTMMTGRRVHRS
jgi:hypothetical protein